MSNKNFTGKIVEDPDHPGELLLDLGNDLCAEMGWGEGDTLEWIDNKDGTFSLKKVERKSL